MDSVHLPLYSAGHVHIGGLIDWETAQEAAKITLREVIKYIDLFRDLLGDINNDGITQLRYDYDSFSHINFNQFSRSQFEIADLNFDEVLDIYDLLLSNFI